MEPLGSATPGAGPAGLHLTLLGGFAVRLGRREFDERAFPRRKAASLVKVLALQPEHALHRDQILDALWPGLDPAAAGAQLYKAVHHARRAFAAADPPCPVDALLALRGGILRLAAPGGVRTDVAAFEQLAHQAGHTHDPALVERAIACYTGDLLPADLYEEWTVGRREALRERYLDLLAAAGEGYLAAGYLPEAADAFRQVLARDPTREGAHRTLMRVYALQGSRTRALRQYRICAGVLARELGVEPAPETAALYRAILDRTIRPLPPSERKPGAGGGPREWAAGSGAPAFFPPLVGRRRELEALGAVLDDLGRGRGAALLLEGVAGIGKTRLARELLQMAARRGWQALLGAAHEGEGQPPYLPFVEALRQALRAAPAHAGLIPAELALAIPELPPSAAPVATADRLAAQSALFAGVLRFLAARARAAPVVLVLDDLHAADDGSLRLFHYLARHAAEQPLLLVGVRRTREPGAPPVLDQIVAGLEEQRVLHRFPLASLSESEHHALLEQALGGAVDTRLAGTLYALSEGNALFAGALARQMAAERRIELLDATWRLAGGPAVTEDAGQPTNGGSILGPFAALPSPALRAPAALRADRAGASAFAWPADDLASALVVPVPQPVHAVVERRRAALSLAALRLLQGAAVAGQDVSLPLLERLADVPGMPETGAAGVGDPMAVLDWLDELLAAGLLEEHGLLYRFPHPLFRSAVYQQLSGARRRGLHNRVAAGLEALSRDEPGAAPVEAIAYHTLQAGEVGRAVRFLRAAGDRAEAVFDHDGALGRYGEALALVNAQTTADARCLQVDLHERMGDVHRAIGDVARSLAAYQQALAALEALARAEAPPAAPAAAGRGDQARRFELHRKIALAAVLTIDRPTAAQHLAEARAHLGAEPLDRARLLIAQALFDWHANELEAAIAHAAQALELAERAGGRVEIGQAYELLALAHLPLGRWEEGLAYELRRQTPDWSPEIVVAVDAHLCLYEFRMNGAEPYRRVEQFIAAVAARAVAIGNLRCLAVCHYVLGSLALLQGNPAEARASLTRSLELNRRLGSPAGVAYTLARQVELLTALGQLEAARDLLAAGFEAAGQAAIRDHCLMNVHTAGIANRLAAADLPGAAALVGAAQQHDAEAGPCGVCRVDLYAAIAAFGVAAGDPDAAAAYVEKALAIARAVRNRPGEARALRAQGQLHAARGDLAAAERCLAEAAATFREVDNCLGLAQTLRAWGTLPAANGPATKRERRALRQEADALLERYRDPNAATPSCPALTLS